MLYCHHLPFQTSDFWPQEKCQSLQFLAASLTMMSRFCQSKNESLNSHTFHHLFYKGHRDRGESVSLMRVHVIPISHCLLQTEDSTVIFSSVQSFSALGAVSLIEKLNGNIKTTHQLKVKEHQAGLSELVTNYFIMSRQASGH